MEREIEPNDPAVKTKVEGRVADTEDNGIPLKGKKAAHKVVDPRRPAQKDNSKEENNSGIKEDQPGRDKRGDRNSL